MGKEEFRKSSKYLLLFYGGCVNIYLDNYLNIIQKEADLIGFQATFKALSDPVRREILTMLKGGRMSAGEISSRFTVTGATISYHLAQLKQAGLVFEEKEKNFIYYQLNASVMEELLLWFSQFGGNDHEKN